MMVPMAIDLLITGFGAFPGVRENPSARLALALGRLTRWHRLGWTVSASELPVGYGPMEQSLTRLLVPEPRAVLMFGIAARSKIVRVEMLARNRTSRTQRDASGRLPKSAVLDAGPPILKGRAPARALATCLQESGLPAGLSRNAGPYLCNAGYRFVLRSIPEATRVIFIHIPRVQSRQDRRGVVFPALLKGAERVALRLALAARLSRAQR
ncbi:Pcp Pyrrolidone-carboxylate peptidase (N-terminal pyroglutamyl peptidase) [Rhabdaerophilaceae bacterium]